MRQLTALTLAGAFVIGISSAAFADCAGHLKTASADQTTSTTKVNVPESTPKSGS
jgi:hypothetical protein